MVFVSTWEEFSKNAETLYFSDPIRVCPEQVKKIFMSKKYSMKLIFTFKV